MTWLADIPVQRKLGYAMLFTSTVASVLACAVFLTVEYIGDRGNLEQTISTLARITADNSSAAIAFDDRSTARQNLEALRAEPQIVAATFFDANGQVFARYNTHVEETLPVSADAPPGLRFEGGKFIVVQPVMEGARRLGTLHLQATMGRIYARMRTYAFIIIGVLASTFGLVGLISSVLRRTIARPILELANTANAISTRQDYSLRARQHGRDELGQLTATFNAMLERTQAAVAGLKESEWAHRELVRALPAAAYMCDAKGLVTLFNDEAVRLWGRTPDIGVEYWGCSHLMFRPDGTPLSLDQSPMAAILREGRAARGEDVIIERPDGTRRNVMPHPELIRDTLGRVVGAVIMLVDITEERRASAAVRQLAAIVESSDDAIISKNLDGCITSWNKGAERLYGYTAEQIVGQSVTLLIPADRLDEEPEILGRIRRNERIEQYDTLRRRRDGTTVAVSLTVSPIRDQQGKVIGASKIARDITERTRVQQQANFLTQLSQQLTALADPDEIMRVASRLTGEFLRTDRCYFCTVDPDWGAVTVKEDWARPGFSGIAGIHRARDFGTPEMWRAMATGPLAIHDKSTHELTRNQGAGYAAVRIGAHATAPLFGERGDLLALLAVASEHPRQWTRNELAFMENVLARVWPVIQRARTQRELQESEQRQQKAAERLNLAIASANLGDWNWDAATDHIILSPRSSEIYGVDSTPTLTRSAMRQLLHPDDRALARDALARAMETHGDYDVEYRVNRPNGTQCWVAAKGRSILGPDGRVTGMVGVVQDITERKHHAEALRENEAQLRLVTDNAPVLLVRTDREHRFTFVNRAYAERNLLSVAEVTGRKVVDVIGPQAYETIRHQMDEALAGARVEFELQVPYERLGRKWIHVIYVPERDAEGKVIGLLGVITDIDSRKASENELKRARDEALAASRAKDDFLAALSHELRTPLNPVLLLASDAAANKDLPAAVRADFDLILKNVNLEARLIDDLLDLTRITRGKLRLDQRRCNVHNIIEDALANVEAELKEKNLQLEVDFTAKSCRVQGDSVRLQQVFWNLLKNAVKFTPVGGKVSVTSRLDATGRHLLLRVTDNGIGMTPDEIGRIFQAFSQGDHAQDGTGIHRFGGLGLGLAITKMVVELHHGKITAFSDGRDRGSVFEVELPIHQENPASSRLAGHSQPPLALPAASKPAAATAYRRILLVEDHAPTRLTLQHLLTHRKFEVTSAESANKASGLASAQEFDLIISDVGLPDRSGYELMAELRARFPKLPGIALSGYGMEEDLQRSRAAGFAVHLVKPVTIGMLEDAIANLPAPAAAARP